MFKLPVDAKFAIQRDDRYRCLGTMFELRVRCVNQALTKVQGKPALLRIVPK